MFLRIAFLASSLAAAVLFGTAAARAESPAAPIVYDFNPPEIITTSAPQTAMSGMTFGIEAEVIDDVGLDAVILHYRHAGESEFYPIPMDRLESGRYRARLSSDAVLEPGIEYFIEARDSGGNIVLRGNRTVPLSVAVALPVDASILAGSAAVAPESDRTTYWKWVVGAVVVGVAALALEDDDSNDGDAAADTGIPPAPATINVGITNAPWPEP